MSAPELEERQGAPYEGVGLHRRESLSGTLPEVCGERKSAFFCCCCAFARRGRPMERARVFQSTRNQRRRAHTHTHTHDNTKLQQEQDEVYVKPAEAKAATAAAAAQEAAPQENKE